MRNKVAKKLRKEAALIVSENLAKRIKGEKVEMLDIRTIHRSLKKDHMKTDVVVKSDPLSRRQRRERPKLHAAKVVKKLLGEKVKK